MNAPPSLDKDPAQKASTRRHVRSFVLRGGRLTDGQRRALETLSPRWGVAAGDGLLDLGQLFGNDHPVIMEIGFGNGGAMAAMAEAEPQHNFLGVEVHRPGIGRLLLRIEKRGLENVRIACADAAELLRARIPEHSLAGIRLYFPDPWPKKRHHKRRIVQPGFVQLLAARVAPGGIVHLATDWAPYAEHMLALMNVSTAFENLSPDGRYCERPDWRPRTKYERRGERLGHEVADLVYRRLPLAPE